MDNRYAGLSDFEINKKVAVRYYQNKDFIEAYKDVEKVFVDGNLFDSCNNPTDTMPIIIENKLTLSPRYDSDAWISESFSYPDIYSVNKNPLRAAMEVLLMIKDVEQK